MTGLVFSLVVCPLALLALGGAAYWLTGLQARSSPESNAPPSVLPAPH
jgi:hypothetical protein